MEERKDGKNANTASSIYWFLLKSRAEQCCWRQGETQEVVSRVGCLGHATKAIVDCDLFFFFFDCDLKPRAFL